MQELQSGVGVSDFRGGVQIDWELLYIVLQKP
jgi:hypothetical protein